MLAGTPEDVSRTVVPGTARAGVDIRFDDADPAARLDGGLDGVAVEFKGVYPAARSDPDSAPVRALAEALRRHGTEPQVRPVAPWWAPYHVFGDVPFASGGPGHAGGAHGPDEWADIEGLRRLMHVTYDALALL
jgi:acetylornithine deacetylase/succinyl-diaminopimelate desuccinylase-like protein